MGFEHKCSAIGSFAPLQSITAADSRFIPLPISFGGYISSANCVSVSQAQAATHSVSLRRRVLALTRRASLLTPAHHSGDPDRAVCRIIRFHRPPGRTSLQLVQPWPIAAVQWSRISLVPHISQIPAPVLRIVVCRHIQQSRRTPPYSCVVSTEVVIWQPAAPPRTEARQDV